MPRLGQEPQNVQSHSSHRQNNEKRKQEVRKESGNQSTENPPKMEVPGSSKKMIATQEEMVEAKVPISYRDQCAHLLIPLNKCRQAEFYLPWKCEDQRHGYEKCEYELVMERMLQMQKIREAQAQQKQGAAQGHPIPLIPKTANA